MVTSITDHHGKEPNQAAPIRTRPLTAGFILILGAVALVLAMAASIAWGAADIRLVTVWEAVFAYNPALTKHQIIQELRMPRALAGALVGASLAVGGAIMQGMSRNPMADTGILGINAGASLMLAVSFAFWPGLSFTYVMFLCFAGAGVATLLVYGIGAAKRGGLSPMRLVLAGAAISALFIAISEAIAIHYKIGQDMAFWYAGGVAGTKWEQVQVIAPWIIGGLLAALLLSRSVTILSLGEDVAAGLGQRTGLTKLACSAVVFMLAGASVSVVGPVGFVGLVVPHMTRALVGVDYRWIIPCSAVLGALLVALADIAARLVNPPAETPIGALIAVLGVPFFLYLARQERREL